MPAAVLLPAQDASGSIRGNVYDSAGGRIAQTTSYARLTNTDIPQGTGSIFVFALPE